MAFRTNKTPVLQEKSASGSVATFNTALAMPLESCTSLISGYQEGSGTPSPSNVRPLHAFSSASLGVNTINQWDEQWEVGYINETTGQVQAGNKFISKNFIPCLPNTQYRKLGTLGVAPAYYGRLLFYYYDENHNFIGHDSQWTADGVFTTPANCHFMKFRSYSSCSSYGNDISINHPSSDENYHAFNGAILTFGQDIYSGYIDWKRGVVTANWVKANTSTMNWYKLPSGLFVSSSLVGIIKNNTSGFTPSPYIKCSAFECVDSSGITGPQGTNPSPNGVFAENTVGAVFFNLTSETTIEGFKAFMSDKQFIYELANPTTIQLPPCPIDTLEGVNNIWSDVGETSLSYNDLNIAKRGSFREVFKIPTY